MDKATIDDVQKWLAEVNAEFPIETWRLAEEYNSICANRPDGRSAMLMRVYPENYARDENGKIKVSDQGDVIPIRGPADLSLVRLVLAAVKALLDPK